MAARVGRLPFVLRTSLQDIKTRFGNTNDVVKDDFLSHQFGNMSFGIGDIEDVVLKKQNRFHANLEFKNFVLRNEKEIFPDRTISSCYFENLSKLTSEVLMKVINVLHKKLDIQTQNMIFEKYEIRKYDWTFRILSSIESNV